MSAITGPLATYGLGQQTASCSYTDRGGLTASASVTYNIVDTTRPPVITVPDDITVEATSASGAAVGFTASALDIVDGSVAVTCTPASGLTFALGTSTVTCSATDAHNNTGTGSFTVTVVDTTAPAITVPSNITAEATGPSGRTVTYTASALDIVDGSVAVTCTPASGSVFPLGETTITCTAKDARDNTASASFTVTVVDTTPPAISGMPRNQTLEATSAAGAVATWTAPTATDLVDGTVAVTCTRASGSSFALGATTVTCTATDAHNNSASASFVVRVAYGWSGILQPINQDGSSVFKLGSTIPVKFQLTGASAGITNATARIYYAKVSDGIAGDDVEAVSTAAATTGNLFRYDNTGGLYIFNLSTKGMEKGTYQIRIDLDDQVDRTVLVSLR